MRAYVDVGTQCNNLCIFCKSRSLDRKTQVKPFFQIKSELDQARQAGLDFIVFSGGEITTRKDSLDIISYAHEIGFTKIQLQTNARKFADLDTCRAFRDAGVTEFLVSINGNTPEIHDWHTGRSRSFQQTVKCIQNLSLLGLLIITNSVITRQNYQHLVEIVRLAENLGASTVQLAYLHIAGAALTCLEQILVRKHLVSPYLCDALAQPKTSHVYRMVEAFPYCLLPGYEQYSADLFSSPSFLQQRKSLKCYDKANARSKGSLCSTCTLDQVCWGPWREYTDMFGWDEFVPCRTLSVDDIMGRLN